MMVGPNRFVAELQEFLVDGVDLVRVQSYGRKYWHALLLCNSDQDVTTTEVVEIIGERAHGVQHAEWVPTFLEFNTLGFHDFPAEQVTEIHGGREEGAFCKEHDTKRVVRWGGV